MTTVTTTAETTAWYWNRWAQLVLGLIAMMSISSPQYVWTLFTGPLNQKLGTTLAELQWTFSLLIILQTWCSPMQAYLVDRFGPRMLISVGALMSGGGWVLSAYVDNIWALYFTYGVICGFGTGIIYVGIIGLMMRWFPDRRGLATGLAAAGYGFGAIFTSFPIDSMIKSSGYAHTLVVWGIILGVIGIVAAQWLRVPADGWLPAGYSPATATTMQSKRSYTPREMLQSPIFWLLFIMMSMMSTSGLMVVSNVGPFAKEFKVADVLVIGMAALPLSLTLSRFTNGLTRPFFGWVSDRIGREMTMFIAFSLECAAILVLFAFIDQPGAVRGAHRPGVLRLGRNLLALPLDADRHVRPEIRRDELRLPLYRAGGRLDPRRAGGGLHQADDRKLDLGVHHRRGARHRHRLAGDHGAADDADQAYAVELTAFGNETPAGAVPAGVFILRRYVSVKCRSPSFSMEVTTLSPAFSQTCLSLG